MDAHSSYPLRPGTPSQGPSPVALVTGSAQWGALSLSEPIAYGLGLLDVFRHGARSAALIDTNRCGSGGRDLSAITSVSLLVCCLQPERGLPRHG